MSGATTAGSVLETTRVGGGSLLDALRAAAEVDLESVLAVLEPLSFVTQLQAIGELYEGRQLAASTEIAPIIQGAIELDDAATKAALEAAIRPPKPRRKPAPKTKSSKRKPR